MQELEKFLEELNCLLYPISINERSHILIEINKQVLKQLEENPESSVHHILKSMKPAKEIARKYLLEKGFTDQTLKQIKNKHPLLKMVLGFILAFLIIIVSSISVLVWKFTPVFKIDENTGKVIVLGGLIDVEPDPGAFAFANNMAHNFNGNLPMISRNIDKLQIDFSNGEFNFKNSNSEMLQWKCKFIPLEESKSPNISENNNSIIMDFTKTKGSKCDFFIPSGISLTAKGINGKSKLEQPHYHSDISIDNGKISFTPNRNLKYDINTSVVNGQSDAFTSTQDQEALKTSLHVLNGKIKNH